MLPGSYSLGLLVPLKIATVDPQQAFMTDSTTSAIPDAALDFTELASNLRTNNQKNQIKVISLLAKAGGDGLRVLREFLLERRSTTPNSVDGKVYQVLYTSADPVSAEFLRSTFPHGLLPTPSDRQIDYSLLQKLLAAADFQSADRITIQLLCELAGPAAVQRKWLYFTEVDTFPETDLQTINTLWQLYSEDKFGFSVQREIWLGVGKMWDKMWPKIGWKNGNNWTRYPQEFTWDLTAPRGHLPLSNQLRGVRVMEKLLSHPAWK
jgi:hypothetical protein